jgi:hypothetical protein
MDNKKMVTGLALVGTAVLLVGALFASAPDSCLVRLLGKGVWYLPYAALVGGVRKLGA